MLDSALPDPLGKPNILSILILVNIAIFATAMIFLFKPCLCTSYCQITVLFSSPFLTPYAPAALYIFITIVTNLWLVPQLCFCLIPTCNHLLLTFGFFLDYSSSWSQTVSTYYQPLSSLLTKLLLDPYLLHLLPHPGLLTSWWGDHEDHDPSLAGSYTHLRHQELWWRPVSA